MHREAPWLEGGSSKGHPARDAALVCADRSSWQVATLLLYYFTTTNQLLYSLSTVDMLMQRMRDEDETAAKKLQGDEESRAKETIVKAVRRNSLTGHH